MAQKQLIPNPENASLADLHAAMRAGNKETYRRCIVIIMLLTGSSQDQAMRAFDLCESAIKKIVRAFNLYGVDGLIAKKRTGRKPVISCEQKEQISKTSMNRDAPKEASGPQRPFTVILPQNIG